MSRLKTFLSGVRVLDLSRYLPGPLATLMLADFGADVLKIEPPNGDEVRQIGPTRADGRPAFYEAISAGKSILTLDLKSPVGRQRFLELCDDADVVVESFRPDVMIRLGLGSATLRARNPRLIYVALSGYGRAGPLRDVAGHDANYLGAAGALKGNGNFAGNTLFYPPMADCLGSMTALSAILGALLARERDGRGCDVDIALADAIMPLQTFSLAELAATGAAPRREADLLNGGWACYRIYCTADSEEAILGAVEEKFWRAFCVAAGHPEWAARQREPLPQASLIEAVKSFFAERTWAHIERQFAGVDCCLSRSLDLREAVHSEYVQKRGIVRWNERVGTWEAVFPVVVDGETPALRGSSTTIR